MVSQLLGNGMEELIGCLMADVFIDFIELKELDRVDGAGMLQLNQPADVLYRRIFALQIGHRADQVAIVKTH